MPRARWAAHHAAHMAEGDGEGWVFPVMLDWAHPIFFPHAYAFSEREALRPRAGRFACPACKVVMIESVVFCNIAMMVFFFFLLLLRTLPATSRGARSTTCRGAGSG